MLPLLTFASGIVAGIVGVRLLKSAKVPENLRAAGASAATGLGAVGEKARQGMEQAQAGLKQAAVSGLSAVEKSSASLRAKIGEAPQPMPAAETAPPAATTAVTSKGVAAGTRAQRAPSVRKTRAHKDAGAAAPKRARGRRKPAEGGGEAP
jgi:hypothetical protein